MNLEAQPLCLQTHTSQNNSSDVKIRTDHWDNSILITATTAVYENWTTRTQPHQTRPPSVSALNPQLSPRAPSRNTLKNARLRNPKGPGPPKIKLTQCPSALPNRPPTTGNDR